MSFAAPRFPVPTADEREVLLGFLHWKREQLVRTTNELTEEQLRWTPDGRLLPILGIINHLTHVEWRWIDGRYLGEPFPARTEEFHVEKPSADVIDAYWHRAQRTAEIVRSAPDLNEPCLGTEGDGPPLHVMFKLSEPVHVRWAVLHLIEETAHHVGHAESTREMLDGKKMSG